MSVATGESVAAEGGAHGRPLLQLHELVKRFAGTLAVDHVDFDVRQGEVHALLGENGAGKSTIIKMLAGVHEPDSGEIHMRGERVDPASQKLPIAFIHQDLALFESMTVAENFAFVAGFPRPRGLISWRAAAAEAERGLRAVGSEISPLALVSTLSMTEKSIVAVARALALESELLLVLDEPTASLPEAEVARLFDTLRVLRERGVGIIYVTHRLDEVFRIADRITVLRDGRKIVTTSCAETTPTDLVRHIVGRPPSEIFMRAPDSSAESLLEVSELRTDEAGPVSFQVARGEIVGLVGLQGAGQDAIGRAIFGCESVASGNTRLRGEVVRLQGPADAIRLGIGYISSKRGEESLAAPLTVRENLFLNPAVRGRSFLDFVPRREERQRAREVITRFDVRPDDPERLVSTLSGGNQQKVVLARWLGIGRDLMVLEEPTLGVDVGAKAEIYRMLNEATENGAAVLLVSSDFEEVSGVCHRALVFNRGRVIAELDQGGLSIPALTQLAAGGHTAARNRRDDQGGRDDRVAAQ